MYAPSKCIGLLFAATLLGLGVADVPLHSPSAPYGIVSFELCTFAASCEAILLEWDAPMREMALFSLGLDYLFIVLYSAGLLSLLAAVQRRHEGSLVGVQNLAPKLVVLAGLCDVVENFLLIRVLQTHSVAGYAEPAGYLAAFKFFLLGVVAIWIVGGWAVARRV